MPAALTNFFRLESLAGALLIFATLLALVVSNSALTGLYEQLLNVPLSVSVGELVVQKPILLWINDGLMAVFFFLIGLEVKREMLEGQLTTRSQVLLPALAAVGGFVVPALIYTALNWGNHEALEGWAIPSATDIAFALGVLMLLGSRVPLALKVFLTSIAIFDDIAAIAVIAMFYTDALSLTSLVAGVAGIAMLALFNRAGVKAIGIYTIVGIVVWFCVLESGVHATLAGFAVACTIPLRTSDGNKSPLKVLEHALHPYVVYLILPVFAFANAGVSFAGVDADVAFGTVSLGIVAGLVLGKQLGVMGAVWLAVRLKIAKLPQGCNWLSVYGVALLTGIGFTMSIFVGSLAFERGQFDYLAATRVGVLAGSLISAVAGYLVLRMAFAERPAHSFTGNEEVSRA